MPDPAGRTEEPLTRSDADNSGYLGTSREVSRDRAAEEMRVRLAAIVESSDDAIIGKTPGGTVTSWNSAAERLYGYSAEEAIGQPITMLAPPDRPGEIPEILEKVRRGEKVDYLETIRVSKDGRLIDVALTVSPIKDAGGSVVGASTIARDITERKRAEERLREKEAQYRSIFEATSDGLVITDLHGNLVDANPAFCSMHGYDTCEELVGRQATEWVHPDYRQLHEDYAATVKAGGRYQAQGVHVRKDGTSFPVEVHGSAFAYRGALHVLGVVRDVTERARAYELLERRVKERTRELSTLLEISKDVASTLELEPLLGLILDQLKTVVDYTDSSLLVFEGEDLVTVGYRGPVPQERIMGTRFPPSQGRMMLEGPGYMMEPIIIDDIRSDAPLARAYRQVVGEERLRKDFGHVRSWLGVPLVSKGQPIGLLAIIHDKPGHYTERHAELARTIANQAAVAIENAGLYEQAQSTAALEERQRLARELHDSVSQALYGITLGADAAITLLERDPNRVAEPLEYVRLLAEAGLAEMRALIFELRPESLENEGLIVALEKQAAALRTRHEISVRTTICCEEPDVPLEAKEALYRVAQEALHNTVKHARASSVELNLQCGANGVTLWISDDGVGFDPAGSFPGHLGLKSMRERTMRLGGTLEVTSEPGKGTRLRAWIPSRR
jgi:PAS domain S-box-containing protein